MGIIEMIARYMPDVEGLQIVAKRDYDHPKVLEGQPREIMRIDLKDGNIPPGIILGKGTRLYIEPKYQSQSEEEISNG